MFKANETVGYVSAVGHTWEKRLWDGPWLYRVKEARRGHIDFGHRFEELWAMDGALSSGLSVKVAGRMWDRPTGSVHLYPPGTLYHEVANTLFHSCWILFYGGAGTVFETLTHNRQKFARLEDPQGIITGRLREMAQVGHIYGDNGFYRVQAMFFSLMDLLSNTEKKESCVYRLATNEPEPVVHPVVAGALSYFQKRLAEPVTLEDVARALGVSSSLLSHRFRQEMGEGPMKVLNRIRVDFAKSLLRRGDPLKSVAAETGFCDESHLSKVFKRVAGVTPGAFVRDGNG